MAHPLWPLYDLRLVTGRLELRLPQEHELPAFVAVAKDGIHPPEEMPFGEAWTDVASPEFERSFLVHHFGLRVHWKPEAWGLALGVWVEGEPAGFQNIGAQKFHVMRTVETGSWLGSRFQGQGVGKEMRAAVLHLAFAGLDAAEAISSAMLDNPSSLAVSRALGYEDNGFGALAPRGERRVTQLLRLTRERWETSRRKEISIDGLDACRDMFGI